MQQREGPQCAATITTTRGTLNFVPLCKGERERVRGREAVHVASTAHKLPRARMVRRATAMAGGRQALVYFLHNAHSVGVARGVGAAGSNYKVYGKKRPETGGERRAHWTNVPQATTMAVLFSPHTHFCFSRRRQRT